MKTHLRSLAASLAMALAAFALNPTVVCAKETPENMKLIKATDPYEVLSETISSGDIKEALKVEKALARAEAEKAATKALLAPDVGAQFDFAFAAMQDAHAKKDTVNVALCAAEVYKLIVSSLNSDTLVIPMPVDLLDYCGFRGLALLKAPSIDWKALGQNAHEAARDWKKMAPKVTNEKLHAAVDKAIKGMADAATAKDAALGESSAQAVLDLVDELEYFFEGKPVTVN